jgi:hypothetical protein
MGSIASAPAEERLERLGVDERRALIDRIAASAQFRRSARLREFLLYVGGQSLKDGCPDIHEQEIGAKVFGRSSTYDRSQDNIVRVTATELRKRIELYFASEGAHETCSLPSAALQTPQIWASILPVSRQTLVGTSPWTLNFVRPYPEFTPWAIATERGLHPHGIQRLRDRLCKPSGKRSAACLGSDTVLCDVLRPAARSGRSDGGTGPSIRHACSHRDSTNEPGQPCSRKGRKSWIHEGSRRC